MSGLVGVGFIGGSTPCTWVVMDGRWDVQIGAGAGSSQVTGSGCGGDTWMVGVSTGAQGEPGGAVVAVDTSGVLLRFSSAGDGGRDRDWDRDLHPSLSLKPLRLGSGELGRPLARSPEEPLLEDLNLKRSM